MYKYYLGIDVAKVKCDTILFDSETHDYSMQSSFKNDISGIVKFINDLKEFNKDNILVILESTAHYHELSANILFDNGFNVSLINPIITSKVHTSNIRKTKNDKIDAKIIAKIGFDNNLDANYNYNRSTYNLKKLCRSRKRIVSKKSKTKVQIRTCLDYLAPDFVDLFSDVFSTTVLNLLDKYTLDEILVMSDSKLLKLIDKSSKGKLKMTKVKEIKECLKLNKHQITTSPMQCLELNLLIKELLFFNAQVELLEIKIINESPEDSTFLQTIPGVGEINAAVILGELGDIKRFNSPKQLVAYAGLDSSTYQSGNVCLNGRISKRGSPQLRNTLYLSATAAMMHSSEWRKLYDKHKANGKHHYVVINALARKLLHVIWGMYKTNTPYNAELI